MTEDPHDALRARVGLYFDGELPVEDERDVLDHLAGCEICQAELEDVLAIHVAAQASPAAVPRRDEVVVPLAARAPRRRRGYPVVAAVALAAAAVLAIALWPREHGA